MTIFTIIYDNKLYIYIYIYMYTILGTHNNTYFTTNDNTIITNNTSMYICIH